MEATISKMKEQLETLITQRVEIEGVLKQNRDNVIQWLGHVQRACQREVWQIHDNGDIADGEIQVPWNLLQEAIAQLRETQELLRISADSLHEIGEELEEALHPDNNHLTTRLREGQNAEI